MLRNLPAWQKNTLRLLAWGCLFSVVWAICQDLAFGQEHVGVAVEETPDEVGFLGSLLRSIFSSSQSSAARKPDRHRGFQDLY